MAEEAVAVLEQLGKTSWLKSTTLSVRNVVEDGGLEDVDASVDGVGEHLTPAGLLEELADLALVVDDDDAVLEGIWNVVESEGRFGVRDWWKPIMSGGHVGERSPEMTTNGSSRRCSAFFTDPPVPSGTSSTE